jgi:acyl-CoA hydrolase
MLTKEIESLVFGDPIRQGSMITFLEKVDWRF